MCWQGVEVGGRDVKHLLKTAGNTAAQSRLCKTCKQAENNISDNESKISLIIMSLLITMTKCKKNKSLSHSRVFCFIQRANQCFSSCVAAQVEVFLPRHMTVLSVGNKYLTKWPAGVLTC